MGMLYRKIESYIEEHLRSDSDKLSYKWICADDVSKYDY